jgi:hypothetical protein
VAFASVECALARIGQENFASAAMDLSLGRALLESPHGG